MVLHPYAVDFAAEDPVVSRAEHLAVIYGSIMTFPGIAMFLSPIVVGAMRDSSGSFLQGFLVCAVPGWAVLLTGLFLPREVVSKPM